MGRRTAGGTRPPLPEGYMTKAEAAQELEVTSASVSHFVRQRVLIPCYFESRQDAAFLRSEVLAFKQARNEGVTDLQQVKTLALMALSTARRSEQRLTEVYERLGLTLVPLDRDAASIRALYEEAQRDFTRAQVRDAAWLRYWGGCFFAMDETYLELVESVMGTVEPWKVFFDFASKVTYALYEEGIAHRVFQAGREHLRYVSYMHCRRTRGAKDARVIFDGGATAVEELHALLH